MGIDRRVAAVYKETEFAKTAAFSYHLIDVGVRDGVTRALESEISVMSAESFFNRLAECLRALVVSEVYGFFRAHSLGERKTIFVTVNRYYVLYTHGTKNGYADKTDRSAALHYHSRVKTKNARSLGALYRVYQNRARLYQNSRIEVEVAYVEYRRTLFDKDIIGKPACEIIVPDVLDKSVNVGFTYVLFVKVVHGDFGVVRENHAGNNLIA